MSYLTDTNVISEVMKREPVPSVAEWVTDQEQLCLSVITVEELMCGLSHRDTRRQLEWLEKLLRTRCQVLPVTEDVARSAGTLRGRLLRDGVVCTQADMLIAATAILHGLTLVTRNTRDFERCGVALLNPFLVG